MEAEGASPVAFVEGGNVDPNQSVFHEGEASSSNPDSGSTTGFSKILEVDLVMEELLRNLSFKEMKVLSLVSKDALIAVRQSKVFSERARFQICKESIRSGALENCSRSWKDVVFFSPADDDGIEDYVPESSTLVSVKSFLLQLEYPTGNKDSVCAKIDRFALKIIESLKDALEDLKLHFYRRGMAEIESIHCPNLKRFGFFNYMNPDGDNILEAFLKNQPPLEELTVQGISLPELFTGLQGRMSKLRKLEIKSDWKKSTAGDVDWSMVAHLTRLEEISLLTFLNTVQDYEQIIFHIPTETVTKMSVAVRCLGQEAGKHIHRFTNLVELSLKRLENFDDASLQLIIKHCQKLKILSLGYLNKVSDFGVSGVKISALCEPLQRALSERGVSLIDLKGLSRLTIEDCRLITLPTLLRVIQFEFLTSLNLFINAKEFEPEVLREFLLQILERNPSLTEMDFVVEIESRFNEWGLDDLLEKEVRILCPRIQRLQIYCYTQYVDYASEDDFDPYLE